MIDETRALFGVSRCLEWLRPRSRMKFTTMAVAMALLLAACGRQLDVSARFDDAAGLLPGTPVYLHGADVGEVARVAKSGDTTTAELSLDPAPVSELRAGSAALLTTRAGSTVIELHDYRPGTGRLKSGATLVGLNGPLEYAAWRAGEALDTGAQSVNRLAGAVTAYFQGGAWQRRRKEMNRSFGKLRQQLGQSYQQTNEAYQDFLDNLESQSEQAREQARQSYAELAGRLRAQIRQLEAQGREEVVKPLQQLLDEISRTMKQRPQEGSASADRTSDRLVAQAGPRSPATPSGPEGLRSS